MVAGKRCVKTAKNILFLHTHHYSRQIMQIIYNDAQDKLFNLKNKMKYFSQIEVSPLQSPGLTLTG